MAKCGFVLNNKRYSHFICGEFLYQAFSGQGEHQNNPASCGVKGLGPIPLGKYYIVDRLSGGQMSGLRDWWTDRDEWFALYKDDGEIDDQTFVDKVKRGNFRLHPVGPRGISEGCITLRTQEEFDHLRPRLLAQPVAYIDGTKIRTYGTVKVTAPT